MDLAGGHPEWFGAFFALTFLVSYLVSAGIGIRRGWPPAAWLLVLAAAGAGAILGARLFPLGVDGLVALGAGELPETPVRRLPAALTGAILAAIGMRRALGIRRSVLDPMAYGGLAGVAVLRVGCWVAGCCFGTPTDGPWGVTYAEGSFVHGYHVAHGIVEAGAAGPLAVHPIALYDVAFALVGLALLPGLSRRLRAAGSLCWSVVGAYALFRFAQDFVRANEVTGALGLTEIQLASLIAAPLALGWVLWRETRARCEGAAPEAALLAEPGLWRLAAGFAALVALRAALDGWWSRPEEITMIVRLLPAGAALALVAWREVTATPVRWGTALAGAGVPLVLAMQLSPADSSRERFSYLALEAHAAQGAYEDAGVCSSSLHEYRRGGIGGAHVTVDPDRSFSREVGVRMYAGTQETAYGVQLVDQTGRPLPLAPAPGPDAFVVAPYLQVEGHEYAGHIGLQIGQVPTGGDEGDSLPVSPSFGFRVGPRSFHLHGGFLDGPHFAAPSALAHIGLGMGRLTARGQEVRLQIGASDIGPYASGTLALGPLEIEPMVAVRFGEESRSSASGEAAVQLYQASLRARYSFFGAPTPPARIPAAPDSLVPPDTTPR